MISNNNATSNNRVMSAVVFDGAGTPYQVLYPSTPTYNNALIPVSLLPEQGTFQLIPHRLFVGGFSSATTESELRSIFEKFGHVREAKVIRNSEGTSKGYGFITFDSENDAKSVMIEAEKGKFELKGRRLNLGPAIRRTIHGARISPAGQVLTANGFGGYSYGGSYPQSGYVVISTSPTPAQSTIPSFLYSPTFAPNHSSFVYPVPVYEESVAAQLQMQPQIQSQLQTAIQTSSRNISKMNDECALSTPTVNNKNPPATVPVNEDISNTNSNNNNSVIDNNSAYPNAYLSTASHSQSQHPPHLNQFIDTHSSILPTSQPLTPVTPSMITRQQTFTYPSPTCYPPTDATTMTHSVDMTHYSQMNHPPIATTQYFVPCNQMNPMNRNNNQAMAIQVSASHSLVQQQLITDNITQRKHFNRHLAQSGYHINKEIGGSPVRDSVNSLN